MAHLLGVCNIVRKSHLHLQRNCYNQYHTFKMKRMLLLAVPAQNWQKSKRIILPLIPAVLCMFHTLISNRAET